MSRREFVPQGRRAALHTGARYVTVVRARVPLRRLVIGHTLPHGAGVHGVRLDGRRVRYRLECRHSS